VGEVGGPEQRVLRDRPLVEGRLPARVLVATDTVGGARIVGGAPGQEQRGGQQQPESTCHATTVGGSTPDRGGATRATVPAARRTTLGIRLPPMDPTSSRSSQMGQVTATAETTLGARPDVVLGALGD